ncbi:MAG: sulfurtransferase TusA family protein [Pseudomonadota bacterium]
MDPVRHDTPDAEIDTCGLLCPLPVLKARKKLLSLPPGSILKMTADDPAAMVDVPHFCAEQGHELLDQANHDGVLEFTIRRA